MKLKEYLKYVAKNIPADSEKPTDIVQALSCLIASRLAVSGKLPVSCGHGDGLDMDIVQAGILAGLEKIADYDSTQGTMRQFLYPSIAGTMQAYAWERENRIADSRSKEWPTIVSFEDNPEGDSNTPLESGLVDTRTTESDMIDEEDAKTAHKVIAATVAALGTDDMALLLRDAQIGYNAALRLAWAQEIGVSIGALNMRLSRLRKAAREWALSVQ